jgi:hypothetical protein
VLASSWLLQELLGLGLEAFWKLGYLLVFGLENIFKN